MNSQDADGPAPKVVYALRKGHHYIKGDINEIGAELEALRERNITQENPTGELTARLVFEAARDKRSPLHGEFVWDKDEAFVKFNLGRARKILGCYQVVFVERDREPVTIGPWNVCVQNRTNGNSVFVPAVHAMTDADKRAHVLKDVWRMITGLQSRLESLEGIDEATKRSFISFKRRFEKAMNRKPKPRPVPQPGGDRPRTQP